MSVSFSNGAAIRRFGASYFDLAFVFFPIHLLIFFFFFANCPTS